MSGEPPAPARAGVLVAAGRLWLVAVAAALLLGAHDLLVNGPELSWAARAEVLSLYLLLAGAAAALLLIPGALVLAVARLFGAMGNVAAALLWLSLAAVICVMAWRRDLGAGGALIGLVLATAFAAWTRRRASFSSPRPWRAARILALAAIAGLPAAAFVLRRLESPRPAARVEREGRPDIVLVVLDTLRADHLGAYGDARGLSPTFDRLAAEGALFERCHSPAPWTVPSHASLFTGLMPPSHGCSFEHHRWLDRRFVTLAEALAERAGYQTAAFVANDYVAESNLLQGFERSEPAGRAHSRLAIRPLLELIGWPARLCDHGAADALDRVGRFLARERDPERPLFLFLNLLEVHWRHLPPLAQRLAQTRPEPGLLAATKLSTRYYGPLAMAGQRPEGPLEPSLRALYAAAVQYQDEKLGELIDLLDRSLDLDRAVLAVTSDHGENLGDGGRFDHVFAVNDALTHVPLVLRHPAAFPAGARVPGLCQLVDLPVTLLELARPVDGLPLADGIAGRSLLPARFEPREVVLAFGDPYLGHLEAMARHTGFNRDVLPFAAVLRSASDGTHKLLRSSAGGERLFDLRADPGETTDVAAEERAALERLRVRLDAELSALPPYVGPPQHPCEDPDFGPIGTGLDRIGYVGGGGR